MPDVEAFLNRIGSQEYYDAQLHGIIKEKEAPKASDTPTATAAPVATEEEYGEDEYVAIDEDTTAERLRKKLAAN